MYIYLCDRDWHGKYTHTDRYVVVAGSPEAAANWVDPKNPMRVRVKLLGLAEDGIEPGVVVTETEEP